MKAPSYDHFMSFSIKNKGAFVKNCIVRKELSFLYIPILMAILPSYSKCSHT